MTPKRGRVRWIVLLAGALAVAAVAAAHDLAGGGEAAGARAFQSVTGGLGTGPALGPESCPAATDARLWGTCTDALDPVPGGEALCPHLGGPVR